MCGGGGMGKSDLQKCIDGGLKCCEGCIWKERVLFGGVVLLKRWVTVQKFCVGFYSVIWGWF